MPHSDQSFIDALNFRYATKKFDSQKKVSDTDFADLLESLRLSPSSFGLQLWGFVVVQNNQLRKQIQDIAWNQEQITQASHLIVLCTRDQITDGDIASHISAVATARQVDEESLKGYKDMMHHFIFSQDQASQLSWMQRQVYIAFGFLMSACALKSIDTCPIEGFDAKKCDELLQLPSKKLASVALCAVGYRAQDDGYAAAKKVRYPLDNLVCYL